MTTNNIEFKQLMGVILVTILTGIFIMTLSHSMKENLNSNRIPPTIEESKHYKIITSSGEQFLCNKVDIAMNGAACINQDTVTVRTSHWTIEKIK